jgi:hypothetical protein
VLSTEQIRTVLSRCSYKPGWSWEVHEDPWEGVYVRFLVDVPDSYGMGEHTTLGIDSWLAPQVSERSLHLWLAWRLGRIESHEMREWLKVDGRPVFDPHKQVNRPEEVDHGREQASPQ